MERSSTSQSGFSVVLALTAVVLLLPTYTGLSLSGKRSGFHGFEILVEALGGELEATAKVPIIAVDRPFITG
jgi:hypothetical protein